MLLNAALSSYRLSHTIFLRCPFLPPLFRIPPFPVPPFSRMDSSGFTAAVRLCYTTLPPAGQRQLHRRSTNNIYKSVSPPPKVFSPLGPPAAPPSRRCGRPQRGGMDDGRTFICRNLAAKWLSRTTLILTRRSAASKKTTAALRLCARPERRKEEKYKSRQIKRIYFERKNTTRKTGCAAKRRSPSFKKYSQQRQQIHCGQTRLAVICPQ